MRGLGRLDSIAWGLKSTHPRPTTAFREIRGDLPIPRFGAVSWTARCFGARFRILWIQHEYVGQPGESDPMTNDPASTKPFGARFAESWELLQRFLADLDPAELKRMDKMDASQTLDLLRKQPAIGLTETMQGSPDLAPEKLALAIIRSRVEVLEESHDPSLSQPWGARFLAAWKQRKMPLSAFNYTLIQALKVANEGDAKKILARNLSMTYGRANTWTSIKDPERAASEVGSAWQLNQVAISMMFLAVT